MDYDRPKQYPTELYGLIIEFISTTPTLFSLLLTSRVIKVEAERVLYRSITLTSYDFPARAFLLFDCVSNCERLAHIVHHLSLDWQGFSNNELITIRKHLVPALDALVNLKSLICTAPFGLYPPKFRSFPFQLKEFLWRDIWDGDDLAALISNQPRLETLSVRYGGDAPLVLPPSACQELSVLAINGVHISAFLHCRNIKYLEWNECQNRSSSILSAAESLHNLRALVLKGTYSDDLLISLAPHLPQLQYLAVEDTTVRTPSIFYFQRLEHSQFVVPENYLAFTALRGLTLLSNEFYSEPPEPSPPVQSVDMTETLMAAISNLRFVEVGPPWPFSPLCRLERGEAVPRIVWPQHDWRTAIA